MNSYRAQVTSQTVHAGTVVFTTFVAAKTAKQALRILNREGYSVVAMQVLVFG